MKSAFPIYELNDLSESITYGHTASATKENSGVKFLRITDINNGAVNWNSVPYCECSTKDTEKYSLQRGDIVFARTGATTGKSYLIKSSPEKTVFASYLIRVRSNDKVDPIFLAHFFNTPGYWIQIHEKSRGATLPGVNATKLKELKIPLPPLAEQKRIAAILDKADAIRRKRQAAIKLADDFLRATFLDMFGDPVMNPRGWDINNTLEDVCEKITDGTHHSPPITQTGIPYITAKHLKKGCLDFYAKPWFVSEEDHKAIYNRCDPRPGDVLYIKDGATTGRAAINEYDFEFSMLSSLALIRAKKGLLTSAYLCDWLNNERTKTKLLGGVAGAAITRFTIKKIKDFRIELPPVGLQEEYSQIRKKVMLSMGNQKRAKALADMEFNSLSQKAFRGELGKNGRCSAS